MHMTATVSLTRVVGVSHQSGLWYDAKVNLGTVLLIRTELRRVRLGAAKLGALHSTRTTDRDTACSALFVVLALIE